MLTRTSFNPTLLASIAAAMRAAVGFSREHTRCCKATAYVCNRRGQPTLRVAYYRGQTGAWEFFDRNQRNVTQLVLKALREPGGFDA